MAEPIRHDKTARQLRLLSDALDSGRLGPVRRMVNTLSPAEIGNLLESLPPGKRSVVWGLVDAEDDGEVLVHVGEEVRESLIADMDQDELVAAASDLDIDDLADLVEDLPDTVIDEVLKSMDRENRERLEQVLSYAEDSAGRLMNPDIVTVRADTTIDVVLRYLRLRGELPDHTDHLYVVSKRHQYLGRIALQALLTHEAGTPINQLLDDEQPAIDVNETSAEVARQFSDHDWISAPVVDDSNILLGRRATSPTCRRRTIILPCTAGCAMSGARTPSSTSASTAPWSGCRGRASACPRAASLTRCSATCRCSTRSSSMTPAKARRPSAARTRLWSTI